MGGQKQAQNAEISDALGKNKNKSLKTEERKQGSMSWVSMGGRKQKKWGTTDSGRVKIQ